MDFWNISGWEVTIVRGRVPMVKNQEHKGRKKCAQRRREMEAVEKNDLGFDLSLLFTGYGGEWGPNSP
jgi:hypothetical protein